MESKGSSLPTMPEPANPISMKQPPESLGVRQAGGDMSGDPALLMMDKAAAQLAATLQDGVLQKMAGHSHNNHGHERLKDLTSRVLNGDQDALPKLCAPEPPMFKGAEAPATNGTHQHTCSPHADHEHKATIPQVVQQPAFEPRCANGTSLSTATEDAVSAPEEEEEEKKKRRKKRRAPPPHKPNVGSPAVPVQPLDPSDAVDGTRAADEPDFPPPLKGVDPREESAAVVGFSVGDLVWTKVAGYPWWPCMVTTDPEFNNHVKQKQKAANSRMGPLYHVQYFGDAPERGYIFEKNMVTFTGEDQYQELRQGRQQPASRVVLKRTAPSVPRKLQAQWNMGVIQAKEACGMSLDERMGNFAFLYDDDGPHLNPCILEKLRPKGSNEAAQGTESRLRPDPPPLPGGAAEDPAAAASQSQEGTSTGKKTQGRRTKLCSGEYRRKGKGHRSNLLSNKTAKDNVSSNETVHPQEASQDPTTSAPLQAETVVPEKKKRRPRQAASPAKTVGRRNNTSEPVKKRKPKVASLTADVTEPVPLPLSVKRQRKKTSSADKAEQPKKRRKTSKEAETQDSSEGTDKKQRRQKPDGDSKEPKKKKKTTAKLKALLPENQDAEKPERSRKRKQDGGNASAPSTAKRRRLTPCPEPEGSGSEGRPDSPSDSLDGTKKGDRKKEFVCQTCEQAGDDLVPCEGQCCGMFHLRCLGLSLKPDEKLLCQECSSGVHSCFTCKQSEGAVRRCHVPHCGRFYHEACIRLSPLTVFDNKGFRCPLHACLSCHYGCRSKQRSTKGRLTRCLRCPVAYHAGDPCVAAGSEMVTSTAIICTNHFNAKKGYSHHSHVNVSWCFVCSKGGQLLCCESCPAAFHPDCLNIAMPDGSWFCNDCRAGKKPKYRDIIWVKLGKYRWWPAEIHHPRNIPTNIQHLRHEIGEFPVFFFGSKDYFWTHQGRVFPYMEGDRGSKHQKTGIGKVFKNALLEAEARFKQIKLKREAKEAQENSRKPPAYKFIKVNKPVGKVHVYTADVSEIPKCNCKPADERPCGFESECLNRMLQYECHPQVCPSGARCCNRDFTKRLYPETKIIKTPGKGWGLISLRDVKKGEFVNEYIGELVDEEECRARIKYAHENNISDFYMLTIDKDRIIDAGPKGNYSRFMNHSCQPNCETQKWTVNGDTRVGLFAVRDIPAGTELTFNYNLDCLGNEKTVCRCGAPNCSGFLGDRPKNSSSQTAEAKAKRSKRKYRRRKAEGQKKSDDDCFRCGDGGQLVLCGKKTCSKAYHLYCLNLNKRPFGRWDCPWHHCDVCGKNSEAFCQLCPNSFCKAHQEGALRSWPPTGQLCCLEHEEQPEGPGAPDPGAVIAALQATPPAPDAGSRPAKSSRKAGGVEGKTKRSKRKAAEA
uniref:Nuclear receptor binding SET domain protein 2 n=1 Tax=Gasterosteus aculeatus aculeatus TaxID=481459 RepID=A0AAQ4PC10_GASAC|nr:histone-lysine N-methyltransferase NSD2 isoform X1 [Gasterosteus aculeatus aculeatus]XP_040056258.1 histone-lysine N-methyltransferase NSD2 isoform X1 [Gasterosteus aculeatus aculeatus]XP_040056259.1 histone-lysine N-methyltransferase NSD2 isoform X1 [Gasterosteus aculeatus aculeatus]